MKKIYLLIIFFISLFVININVKALDNGIYIIHSALNENYNIDVYQGETKNGSNIQLWPSNNAMAQKFYIKNNGSYYEIKSVINTNYNIDVLSGIINDKSNIQLWPANGGKAQKFSIEDEYGLVKICSYDSDYCLNVENRSKLAGSNISLLKSNNTDNQKFKLEKVYSTTKTIDDGIYTISPKLNNNLKIDISGGKFNSGDNIHLWNNNNDVAQKFYISYLNDGFYSIKSYYDINYSLDIKGSSKQPLTNVLLYKYNATDNQKWIIKEEENDTYSIIGKCNYLALSISNNVIKNGSNIEMNTYDNSNYQKFVFSKIEDKKEIEDGYYFISLSSDKNRMIDITEGAISENNNVQLWPSNHSLAQKWYIKYNNDGYYQILSDKDSSFSLQVNNGNISIGKYNNLDSQKWLIRKSNNGYYIVSKTDKYIDLYNGNTSIGNNVIANNFTGDRSQIFKFVKTASGISEDVLEDGIYTISSYLSSNMMVDVTGGKKENGTNIQLWPSNGGRAQKFKITYMDNGYYKISSLVDLTKVIDVASSSIKAGTNVLLYEDKSTYNQEWIIKKTEDGYYNIISNCGGQYLDVTGGKKENGTNIQLWPYNNGNAQKFKFIKSEEKTRVIDVSYHQGTIDWNKVYNSGIYGVILRIGYWNTEDGKFAEYINEVKRLGIPYGIYIFSYANTINGAGVEANFTNNIISKYNLNPTLGIYYDLEDWYLSADNTSNTLSKEQYDDIARTYINTVSQYVGSKYKVKIYADLNHVNNRFGDYARSESDWIAHYGVSSCGYKGPHSLWQYTSEATLDGIRGYVDMNYLY